MVQGEGVEGVAGCAVLVGGGGGGEEVFGEGRGEGGSCVGDGEEGAGEEEEGVEHGVCSEGVVCFCESSVVVEEGLMEA